MSTIAFTRSSLVWAVAGFCLVGMSVAAYGKAPVRQLVLQEQLNQTYGPELVSYPFTAKRGACAAESVQVTGPRGVAPAQLTEITYWPGKAKWVKSARLAVLVDGLAPLATDTYTYTYGTKATPTVATDLQVTRGQDSVELATKHIGVRLPCGTMQNLTPATVDVPGPLLAMRLEQGAWGGGSRLIGETPVKSWTAEVTDAGPAFARVTITYTFTDGNILTLAATLAAGDSAVRWEMITSADRPAQGVDFRLPPLPGVKQVEFPQGYGQWAHDRTQPLTPSTEPFCGLSPDTSVANAFPDCPPYIRLAGDGGAELQLRSRDPSAWADPVAPYTYAGFKEWQLDNIPQRWDVWKRKRIAVSYTADGTVGLHATLAQGRRKWSVSAGAPLVGEKLDKIKDMILDWPAAKSAEHPRLFVDKQELQETWTRALADPVLMKQIGANPYFAEPALPVVLAPAAKRTPADRDRVVGALRDRLALLGSYDVMRGAIGTAAQYDALIDSDLLTAQEKKLFRAQMAYLGYLMADPTCWSIERGYLTGNPNMSVSYTLSLGIIACALSDHPLAKTWADYANHWENVWLTDNVGPNGEWLPEGSHYGFVSLEPQISYAIAADRVGFNHFITDPRLKKVISYFAKYHTPRDPQRGDFRVIGAYGRGTSGDRLAIAGLAARMYAKSDPAFSRTMQWLWAEGGYPPSVDDSRLGGYEGYYEDRRLPAETPAWGSELFPKLGALLRAGFATPNESYVNVLSNVDSLRNMDIWTPGVGGIAQWFGRGKPLSTSFGTDTGYFVRHELLRNGVRLAHNWGEPGDAKGPFGYYTETKFGTYAAFPTLDYVRSSFVNTRVDDRDWFPDKLPAFPRQTPATASTLEWTRQLLFLKDADPAGPAYLVLRDTTHGGQPTAWQFWTLSEKLGTPAQAQEPNFLADKPGQTILPARELPQGDRYTAIGQQGVDVEYFIAAPTVTPRHTLRYGGHDNSSIPEWQDLLHLQLPGDGAYYVAIFPRPRAEAAPAFTALDDGKIIKVACAFGTDYSLLASEETTAAAEGVSFRGTSAAVQQRPAGLMLTLGAAGEVHTADYGLVAPTAVTLQTQTDTLTVSLPADSPACTLTLTAPSNWILHGGSPAGVKLTANGTTCQLTLPKGVTRVVLVKVK